MIEVKNKVCQLVAFLSAVSFLCLSLGGIASANDGSERKFSRKIGKATLEVTELMGRQDYDLASDKLEALLEKKRLSAYERSTLSQMSGQVFYSLGLYDRAIEAFQNAIEAGGLLGSERDALTIYIAQLHILNKDYQGGAEMFEQFERDGHTLKSKQIEQVLNAWIAAENYERALPWAERWFETQNTKQRKHYDLLNFLYKTLDMTEKGKNLLLVMSEKWPNDKVIQSQLKPRADRAPRQSVGMIPNFSSLKTQNRGSLKISVNDRDAQPLVRIPPIRPVSATTSGHCYLRFDVTAQGQPINVHAKSCTDAIFEAPAIESVKKWKYNPKVRDGQLKARTGVETKVTFPLANEMQ